MKKLFLLIFLLGLGHDAAIAMDDDDNLTSLSEKLIYLSGEKRSELITNIIAHSEDPRELTDVLLHLVETQYNTKSASRINDVMAKIVQLDPTASQVRFNDATILEHLLHNHKPARLWGGPNTHLPDWIEWFVLRGVPVDGLSEEGYTALVWAIRYKRTDVVQKLLDLGAKPSTVNEPKKGERFTALDWMENNKRSMDPDIVSIVTMKASGASATLSSDPVSAAPATIATALPITTIPVQGGALTTEEVSQAEIQKTTIAWPCVKLGFATGVCAAVVYAGYRWYTKTQPDEAEEAENVEQESI